MLQKNRVVLFKVIIIVLSLILSAGLPACSWLKDFKGGLFPTGPVAASGSHGQSYLSAGSGEDASASQDKPGEGSPRITEWETALYFPDSQAIYLVKKIKVFDISEDTSVSDKVNLCMDELKTAETGIIPQETRVISTELEEGVLTVDLSEEFDTGMNVGSSALNMVFGQIVLTLTEIPGVEKIRFLIEGKEVPEFKGLVELNRTFLREEYTQFVAPDD
ncbi:MAG: GerMN domain-containing protein [Eubacteriales bacterium]|nr:GerMN domain-containing protein [Eubacteriales bacterium]